MDSKTRISWLPLLKKAKRRVVLLNAFRLRCPLMTQLSNLTTIRDIGSEMHDANESAGSVRGGVILHLQLNRPLFLTKSAPRQVHSHLANNNRGRNFMLLHLLIHVGNFPCDLKTPS